MAGDASQPVIAVCANQAWNLVNFRSGLIEGLIANGFAVHALAPPDPAMERQLADLGCAFTPVAIDAAGLAPHRDLATLLQLLRVLIQLRPAALLSWTIKPNVYGALAAGLLDIPALPNVSGLGTAFIRRNLITRIAQQLYRVGFRRAPTVFFQNHDDREEFVAGHLVKAHQARILPGSGINPDIWSPPRGGRPGPRRFLMLARVVADKGVREYVEAARAIRAQWPDARFVLMGETGVANRTAIPLEEVRSWTHDGLIEYLPAQADVRPHIAAADFIVLPSYREGLSRVLLEAAAMGRPIVTTDVPGCRDIVTNGVNGFLCEPRNAGSLSLALRHAAELDDQGWEQMAAAGRSQVLSNFSQERVTALYLQALIDAGVKVPEIQTGRRT